MDGYRYLIADVFTDRAFGGNPLAVLPDATGLDGERMQQIAREFNLPETAFVLPADGPGNTRRVRIFTPAVELPFAGHPTVGTALVLADTGAIDLSSGRADVVFEEGAGPVRVVIQREGGGAMRAVLTAPVAPQPESAPPPSESLAEVLSLAPNAIVDGDRAPSSWSCGVPFLFVEVPDRATLGQVSLDLTAWQRTLAGNAARQIFVLCDDPEGDASDLRARMFAPGLGIPEDPATGAACSALPGHLTRSRRLADGSHRWRVEQGFEMGRPSVIDVEAEISGGAVTESRVGGGAVVIAEGRLRTL